MKIANSSSLDVYLMGDLAVCQRATFHCLESMPRMHGYPIGKDSGTITQLSEAHIPAPSVSSAFDFHLFSSMRTLCSAWFLFPCLPLSALHRSASYYPTSKKMLGYFPISLQRSVCLYHRASPATIIQSNS